MPAWAEAQLPLSIASKTPRQSFGTTTGLGGDAVWARTNGGCGTCGVTAGWEIIGGGAGVTVGCVAAGSDAGGCAGGVAGRGASGSDEACANKGAAQIKAPNASIPDFKTHPPSAATSPS